MKPETHRRIVGHLPERVAYWYAERFGEHPTCVKCDTAATWIRWPEGEPVCLMHSEQGEFGSSTHAVGMIRDVTPEDHFGDDFPRTHA